VLWPQPWHSTRRGDAACRARRGAGAAPRVGSRAAALPAVAHVRARGDHLVPPGGSSRVGARGYVAARAGAGRADRAAGDAPEPEAIVVPLGSGGTVGGHPRRGRRRGAARARDRASTSRSAPRPPCRSSCISRAGMARVSSTYGRRLRVERRYLGAGYGHSDGRRDGGVRRGACDGPDARSTVYREDVRRRAGSRAPVDGRRPLLCTRCRRGRSGPCSRNAPDLAGDIGIVASRPLGRGASYRSLQIERGYACSAPAARAPAAAGRASPRSCEAASSA
jgi:hypothetical protein